MKVTLVSFEGPHGSSVNSVRLRALIAELRRRREEVLLVTSEVGASPSDHAGVSHFIVRSPALLQWATTARRTWGYGGSRVDLRKHKGMGDYRLLFASKLREIAAMLEREVFVPDSRILWRRGAVWAALGVANTYYPDVIVSLGHPVAHMVAFAVCERASKRPVWVAELQDPWPNRVTPPTNPVARSVAQKREAATMKGPNLVIAVTDGIARLYPDRPVSVVPLGTDLLPPRGPERVEPFTVGYFGSLYGDRHSSLMKFLEAARAAADMLGVQIAVRFYGARITPSIQRGLAQLRLATRVAFFDAVPRHEVGSIMARQHLLLSLQGPSYRYAVASKVYDYLMTRRPILSVSDEESCEAQLLKKFPGTYVANAEQEIARALTEVFSRPVSEYDRPGVEALSSQATAARFVNELYRYVSSE